MKSRTLEDRIQVGADLVRAAGDRALGYFKNPDTLVVETKSRLDWVSSADREVETLIASTISAEFPDDGLFGEEGARSSGEWCWVIDPIDGTTNFLIGSPDWGISVGLVRDGKIMAGWLFIPAHDEFYQAVAQRGSTRNGSPLRLDHVPPRDILMIEVGFSGRMPFETQVSLLSRVRDAGMEFRRRGSAAYGFALVAAGISDGYIELNLNSWDYCAGALVVEEAGGRFSTSGLGVRDLSETPIVVASKAGIHDELMSMCSQHMMEAGEV